MQVNDETHEADKFKLRLNEIESTMPVDPTINIWDTYCHLSHHDSECKVSYSTNNSSL